MQDTSRDRTNFGKMEYQATVIHQKSNNIDETLREKGLIQVNAYRLRVQRRSVLQLAILQAVASMY